MSLPIQDQANILHGIGGGWTMRTEIINALLLRETANQRTTMEKWIGYEEEGSLIPRGRETLDMIEGFELRDNEILTLNRVIRLLAYTGHKWIVDPDPIKVQPEWHICTHENTWLRKVTWDPLQWTWRDPYAVQGNKGVPFFQFTTTQTAQKSAAAKV